MTQTVVGLFDHMADAEKARDALMRAGYTDSDISIHREGGATTGTVTTGTTTATGSHHQGGILGWFKDTFGMGDADEDVVAYSEAVRRGGVLMSVQVRDAAQVEGVEDVLHVYGAVNIDERTAQWRTEGWSGSGLSTTGSASMAAGAMGTGTATTSGTLTGSTLTGTTTGLSGELADGEREVIPVVQEELVVGKREVRRGGVRVYTRVIETPVSETVHLREERATVERRVVDRPATEADLAAAASAGTIEVRETAEEAVVGKTARVVEEVEIGKEVTERAQTVQDTVRQTDVRVENVDEAATLRDTTTGRTDRSV